MVAFMQNHDRRPIIMVIAGPAHFSTRDVWEGYVQGLSDLGVEVISYPTFAMLHNSSPAAVANQILEMLFELRSIVTAAIFIDGLFFRGERSWILEALAAQDILTVLVATDDPYQLIDAADDHYGRRFTNELACASSQVSYLPTASIEPPECQLQAPATDIVFVGTIFPDRWPLICQIAQYCEQHKIRFEVLGHFLVEGEGFPVGEWVSLEHRTVSAKEKWARYANSKVVLNIFRETPNAVSANPRIYEVAALGASALLTDNSRSEVANIFEESVYLFDDFAMCAMQIEFALHDHAERLKRTKRAKEIVQASHLYIHRATSLLQYLDIIPPPFQG